MGVLIQMSSSDQQAPGQLPEHVVDPEDYNRNQRFKEIHEARRRVSDFVAGIESPEFDRHNREQATKLAHLVALYILELEPLIDNSDIDRGEMIPDNLPCSSLSDYAHTLGAALWDGDDHAQVQLSEIMQVYSAANRFYATVGMDLDLEEGHTDAGFEYDDILQEGPPGVDASDTTEVKS